MSIGEIVNTNPDCAWVKNNCEPCKLGPSGTQCPSCRKFFLDASLEPRVEAVLIPGGSYNPGGDLVAKPEELQWQPVTEGLCGVRTSEGEVPETHCGAPAVYMAQSPEGPVLSCEGHYKAWQDFIWEQR